MDYKFSERIRALTNNRKIPKWVWGIVVIVFFALVGFSFLLSADTNNSPSGELPGNSLISSTELFFNITLKLGVVLLLIYVFMNLLKRWQGNNPGKEKKLLSVVETTHLNPRQSLHLVKAGDKLLLIGSTDQSVTYLSEFENDLLAIDPVLEPENPALNSSSVVNNFASILAQNFSKR